MRFRTRLYVDLTILQDNVAKLRQIARHNEILFMVKADAYGHGMVPVVRFCVQNLSIKEFGCATLGEALTLRQQLPDLKFEVYVFSDVQIELYTCAQVYTDHRIIPVISSYQDLEFMLGQKDLKNFPLCLKFNIGMNRLGLLPEQATATVELLKRYGRKDIFHLIGHLSSSFLDFSLTPNCTQSETFSKIKDYFESSGLILERTSLANSGAIEQGQAFEMTHIRPGLLLYGASSLAVPPLKSLYNGRLISRLETYIIQTFQGVAGMPIGYGGTKLPEDGAVALIALGYGDGFFTRFQGVHLEHNGHKGIVFGRVNMDMAQIFFPGLAPEKLQVGERFTIWDHDAKTIANLAEQTHSIPYELFCQITTRIPRVYAF